MRVPKIAVRHNGKGTGGYDSYPEATKVPADGSRPALVVIEDEPTLWWWVFCAANGKVLATSEVYASKRNANRGARAGHAAAYHGHGVDLDLAP